MEGRLRQREGVQDLVDSAAYDAGYLPFKATLCSVVGMNKITVRSMSQRGLARW